MTLILSNGDTFIHIDDHQHNGVTWNAIYQWWFKLAIAHNSPKRIWQSAIQIINLRHYGDEIKLMAKRPVSNVKNRESRQADFIGFVNINLTEEEWTVVDKTDMSAELLHMPLHIDYLMDIGKLSLNYSQGGIQVTLTVLEGLSAGYAVSAYSDNLIEALIVLRLKVQNYLDKFPEIYKSGGTKKRRG